MDEQKAEVKYVGIDKEVVEMLQKRDIADTLKDEKLMQRAILNCYCELLSEFKDFNRALDDFNKTITICGADKIADFFTKLNSNVKDEVNRIALQEKMAQSHKKPKKSEKNIVQFPKERVK